MTAMSWREESDALIAQTLAFVQSVTGKPTDFEQLPLPVAPPAVEPQPTSAAPAPVPSESHADAAGVDAAAFEVMRAEAAMIDAAMQLVSRNLPPTPPTTGNSAGRPIASPATGATTSTRPAPTTPASTSLAGQPTPETEFSGEHFTSITSELGLQRDMQAEIRARVATFRANQERFNRERQEYFSSTLAKLRASMNDTPHSDK
jgi:hypothetical protein